MTRRTLLASALLAGCGRKLAPRASGWLFVASASERGIVVADLSEFRRVTTLPLSQVPGQILVSGKRVFATCPEARTIVVVDPERLRVEGRMTLPGRIAAASVLTNRVPDHVMLAVLTQSPDLFLLIDPATGRIVKRVPLPETPLGFDVGDSVAAIGGPESIMRVSVPDTRFLGKTSAGGRCGPIRLRTHGETILAGIPGSREIVTVDSATGTLLARLPLAFRPARFCFNADGGQMFVTGSEGDAIAIVDPYQNQVDQTIVGGASPYGMAVGSAGSQSLLFVTNSGSGDLTIFDIETRGLASSVHIGGSPGEVLLTPGGAYALVIGRESGDVAVVRLSTVLDTTVLSKQINLKPLFTVFPTGGRPQSAAIVRLGQA